MCRCLCLGITHIWSGRHTAIAEVGVVDFFLGRVWNQHDQFGILPSSHERLWHSWALALGLPLGCSRLCIFRSMLVQRQRVITARSHSSLASRPWYYGLGGMIVLVPMVRLPLASRASDAPCRDRRADHHDLLHRNVSSSALEASQRDYGRVLLGRTRPRRLQGVTPRARSGVAAAIIQVWAELWARPWHHHGGGNVANMRISYPVRS
jgi:hypothetical protein